MNSNKRPAPPSIASGPVRVCIAECPLSTVGTWKLSSAHGHRRKQGTTTAAATRLGQNPWILDGAKNNDTDHKQRSCGQNEQTIEERPTRTRKDNPECQRDSEYNDVAMVCMSVVTTLLVDRTAGIAYQHLHLAQLLAPRCFRQRLSSAHHSARGGVWGNTSLSRRFRVPKDHEAIGLRDRAMAAALAVAFEDQHGSYRIGTGFSPMRQKFGSPQSHPMGWVETTTSSNQTRLEWPLASEEVM